MLFFKNEDIISLSHSTELELLGPVITDISITSDISSSTKINDSGKSTAKSRDDQNDFRSPSDEKDCVVCMFSKPTHVCIPCGHMVCCEKCVNLIQVCPVCRTGITQKIKVYN